MKDKRSFLVWVPNSSDRARLSPHPSPPAQGVCEALGALGSCRDARPPVSWQQLPQGPGQLHRNCLTQQF